MIGRNGEEWLFDLNCEGLDSLIACNHVFEITTANRSSGVEWSGVEGSGGVGRGGEG